MSWALCLRWLYCLGVMRTYLTKWCRSPVTSGVSEMTLTQASAFSLAKAKTVQLISHQFSLLFAPRSLVLFRLSLELFLLWFSSAVVPGAWWYRLWILVFKDLSFYRDSWGAFILMPGEPFSSPVVPRRSLTIRAALTSSTASSCPSPCSVSFLGTSSFCLKNSLLFFFILRFRNLTGIWPLSYPLCPELGALYCLSFICPFLSLCLRM